MKNSALKDFLYFFHLLYKKGYITGKSGNGSLKIGEKIYITPKGKYKGNIIEKDLSVLSIDGKPLNNITPSTEYRAHLAFYRTKNEINSVFHAHPIWTIALTDMIFEPIVPVSEMGEIIEEIEVSPYLEPKSKELSDFIFEKLDKGKQIFIIRHHGIFVGADSPENAFSKIEIVENFYKTQKIAFQNGYRISDFQEIIRKTFLDKDKKRGIDGTFRWLIEEMGELSRGIKLNNREKLEEEIADCFAWLCSLSNLLNISLEEIALKKYPGVCSKCKESPCICKEP